MQIDTQLFNIDTYFQQSLLRGLFFFKLLLNISLCVLTDIQNTADRRNFWSIIVHSAYVLWKNIKFSFSSVQSLSDVQLFETPWTAANQAFLSITNSWSLLKLMLIESVMPSNHLTLSRSLLLPPSIFPSMRVFSNESVLCIRWSKCWSFSISPSNE